MFIKASQILPKLEENEIVEALSNIIYTNGNSVSK
jgi:hypothetical protein